MHRPSRFYERKVTVFPTGLVFFAVLFAAQLACW